MKKKKYSLIFLYTLIDKIKFFIAEKISKREISIKVKNISQYYSGKWENRKLINKNKIIYLLDYLDNNIEYYNKLFEKNNINEKVKKDFRYFNDIPHLDKKKIKDNYDKLINKKINPKKIYPCPTGGSTGEKLVILYDDVAADKSSAVTRFCRSKIRVPGKDLHFASDFGDQLKQVDIIKEKTKSFFLGRDNIFFNALDNKDLEKIFFKIKNYDPRLVHCHPSTILMLLNYCKNNDKALEFDIFESSGELLTKIDKDKIQKFFKCRVIQRYGQAEFGIIAYQFLNSEKIYIIENSFFVENYDEEIIVTGFDNLYMPLLKYKTGDLGKVLSDDQGYYIENIVGRQHDQIIINNKVYLTHHIQDILDHRVQNINMFQIKKDTKDKNILMLNIENDNLKDEIISKINYYFQNSFKIKFVKKNEFILKGRLSKFRYIIE